MIAKLALLTTAAAALALPVSAETVAVTNARIVTMGPAGAIPKGTVVLHDGIVVAVGPDARIPHGARVIDAKGMFLTPGLVLAGSSIGINDTVGPYPGGRSATGAVTAAFNAAGDFNPLNAQVGEARIEGVTRAVLTPNGQAQGKLFGGEGAVVLMRDGRDAVVRRHAGVVVDAGEAGGAASGGGRDAVFARLSLALSEVRSGRIPASQNEATALSSADLVALRRVTSGAEPLLFQVDRAADILNVIAFARAEKINAVLLGAAEGWVVADRIAAAGIPVVIEGGENQPATFDKLNASYENAALLHKAGVLIAMKPGIGRTMYFVRTPRFNAGRAVRFGLSWHDALATITIAPSRIFGFADRSGSIEIGKDADLVLWSGDPLETSSVARMVMIKGVEQSMIARNRMLRDRYLPTIKQP